MSHNELCLVCKKRMSEHDKYEEYKCLQTIDHAFELLREELLEYKQPNSN